MKLQQTMIYSIREPFQGSAYQDFNFKFSYLSVEDYQRLIQEQELQVVAFVHLNHRSLNRRSRIQVEIPLISGGTECVPCYSRPKGTPIGYLQVDETTFICLESQPIQRRLFKQILSWGLVVLLILPTFPVFAKNFQHVFRWLSSTPQSSTEVEIPIHQNTLDWDGQFPLNGAEIEQDTSTESIEIPGYADLILTATQPSIHLINPGGNDVYFKYTIKQSDTVLYETDLIEPGKMMEWNLRKLLGKGDYVLTFEISTFNLDNLTPNNGAIMTVSVIIK